MPLDATWSLRRLGFNGCCRAHWWHPTEADTLYTIDGPPGTRAGVYEWSATSGEIIHRLYDAPPAVTSPDGRYQIYNNNGHARIVDTTTSDEWTTPLLGATPAISPDNTRITWVTSALMPSFP